MPRELREQNALGHLDVPHPKAAAEQFFAMITSFQHFRALMGIQAAPRSIEASAQRAVATFLRAFQRKPVVRDRERPTVKPL